MADVELTVEEKKAIRALKRVAKTWPSSLWLYSASGRLCVMRKNEAGEHAFAGTGIDPDYIVAEIDIEHSGGDW